MDGKERLWRVWLSRLENRIGISLLLTYIPLKALLLF